MRNNEFIKAAKIVGNGIIKVLGTMVIVGIGLAKANERHNIHTSYNDAVKAIMDSDMWSVDKAKAISALKLDSKPTLYKAIIEVANNKNSWSSDRLNTIIEMCKK